MSRCRKDDGRFQPHSSSGAAAGSQGQPQQQPQGSPARHHYGPPVTGFPAPVAPAGHNYIRSKEKDKERTVYIGKDRIKSADTAENHGRNFAQEKQASIRNPVLNSGDDAAERELSWADEVELTLTNSRPQRPNMNNPGVEKAKSVNATEQKSPTASNDLSQKIMTEPEKKLSKDVNANTATGNSNGKAEQHNEKDPVYYKRANCPQPRRGSRKKTLSLNPEEREALENLIEEVLMDGAIDSESASSDDDAEPSESWKNAKVEGQSGAVHGAAGAGASRDEDDPKSRNDKGKMGRKYYPGQLKVALKHMTELPPRFSRKLKKAEKYLELNTMHNAVTVTGRIEEEDEESVTTTREEKHLAVSPRPPEREKEKAKLKEHHAKEFKRSIRTLLRDHNQYAEDGGTSNSSSIHPPGAIICEDLERETLSMQRTPSAELVSHEVPSSVQNLMLAAKAVSAVDANVSPDGIFHENEAAGKKSFAANSDLMSQRCSGSYMVQDTSSGGQFVMNVPEFVPAGMVSAYSSSEVLRTEQHVQQLQYATALIDQTLGAASGGGSEPVPRHGISSEQMSVVSLVSPNGVPNGSLPSELMSSRMMEFSVSIPPPLMTYGTSLAAGPIDEKMISPMTSTYVPSEAQIPMSTMPSHGTLPYYQFQGQNMPPPPASYAFPIQAPYSSSQYCFMPPALPPQTIPPAYYPRDQSPYPIDAMHYKSVVNPDWGYKKSEQFADSIPAYPNYSAYSNLNFAHVQYPIFSTASGMNQMNSNFRQRKKQSGSNVSPRAMGSSSSVGSGKLLNQRTKQSENLPAPLRTGHRMGQEAMPASLHLDNGLTAPAFADSAPKRIQINARNRAFGDGSSGYPGRRENRNFASEKYASQRAFGSDGKKEGRHIMLKPKQTKPNRSSARSRSDASIAQLHPVKPYHPSDLSEEGLESPDNFGDVESGADDWSTDNYDQEVSRKAKQEDSTEVHNELKATSLEKEAVITLAVELEVLEETCSPPVEEIPVVDVEVNVATDTKGMEHGLSIPERQEDVVATVDRDITDPLDDEFTSAQKHSSETSAVVDEDFLCLKEVDRSTLAVENVKEVAEVRACFTVILSNNGDALDKADSLLLQTPDDVATSVNHLDPECDNDVRLVNNPLMEVSRSDAHLETSSVDMELFEGEIKTDQLLNVNSDGMKLVLGSKFIYKLREMFEGSLHTDSSVCLPMTVSLSHSLLSQLHKEISSQTNFTSNSQNPLRNKSFEEIENQKVVDVECNFEAVNATFPEEQANNLDSNNCQNAGDLQNESDVIGDCKTESVFSCVVFGPATGADEL